MSAIRQMAATGSAGAATGRDGRITIAESESAIRTSVPPLPARIAPAAELLGATLAEPVVAVTSSPRADSAATDGYAVSGPGPMWSLRSEIRIPGRAGGRLLDPDCAVRISTGAVTPRGTTAVLREEHVVHLRAAGRTAITRAPGAPHEDDTHHRGDHWRRGDVLIPAGATVSAAVVSVARSAEQPHVSARGPVEADVLITGDEIRLDGPLGEAQTRDAVSPALPEFLRSCDIGSRSVWHLGDDPDLLQSWFCATRSAPLAVVVGGTGHGATDHLRATLTELGARIIVSGLAVHPGGSQLVALLPDGRVVLGLPGDPFAAIAALLVTGPAIVDALTARTPRRRLRGRMVGRIATDADLTRITPVQQVDGGVWRSLGAPRTPHLGDLVRAQALALTGPVSGPDGLAELIMLTR